MRTKKELLDLYKDESLTKAKTEDVSGLTEALKLEVLIDIRNILNEMLIAKDEIFRD